MSRRAQKKVSTFTSGTWSLTSSTTYLYDGWNLIKEIKYPEPRTLTPEPSYYVWGLDLSGSLQGAGGIGGLLSRVTSHDSLVTNYLYDGNGNVSELVDGNGNIVSHYEYDPYGNTIKADGLLAEENPFRFSSKYHDAETGLYYYGYRYYSPVLGRWLNRDPLGEQGGMNLYAFCHNAPLDNVDINGLIPVVDQVKYIANLIFKWVFGDNGRPNAQLVGGFCYKGHFYEVVFMNGIMNDLSSVQTSAFAIEDTLRGRKPELSHAKVGYIHNKTGFIDFEGKAFWGSSLLKFANDRVIAVPYDLVQVTLERYGLEDDTSRYLGDYVNRRMSQDDELRMILVAHSQGGAKLKRAYDNVGRQYGSRVKVITAAGAQIGGFQGADVTTINKWGDLVQYVGNNGAEALVNSLITQSKRDNVRIPYDGGWSESWKLLPPLGLFNHSFIENYLGKTVNEIVYHMDHN